MGASAIKHRDQFERMAGSGGCTWMLTQRIGSANALGTGPVILGGATLVASSPTTIASPVYFNGGTTTVAGSSSINLIAPVTLLANSTIASWNCRSRVGAGDGCAAIDARAIASRRDAVSVSP